MDTYTSHAKVTTGNRELVFIGSHHQTLQLKGAPHGFAPLHHRIHNLLYALNELLEGLEWAQLPADKFRDFYEICRRIEFHTAVEKAKLEQMLENASDEEIGVIFRSTYGDYGLHIRIVCHAQRLGMAMIHAHYNDIMGGHLDVERDDDRHTIEATGAVYDRFLPLAHAMLSVSDEYVIILKTPQKGVCFTKPVGWDYKQSTPNKGKQMISAEAR